MKLRQDLLEAIEKKLQEKSSSGDLRSSDEYHDRIRKLKCENLRLLNFRK